MGVPRFQMDTLRNLNATYGSPEGPNVYTAGPREVPRLHIETQRLQVGAQKAEVGPPKGPEY